MPNHQEISKVLQSNRSHSALLVFFIPSKAQGKEQLPKNQTHEKWAKLVSTEVTKLFSGATQMPKSKGYFFSQKKKVVEEDVTLIHCYADPDDLKDPRKLAALAYLMHRMGKVLDQEEIGLVIDGVFHKISEYPLYEGEDDE